MVYHSPKILPLPYLLELLAKKDMFSFRSPGFKLSDSLLQTVFKPELLDFLRETYLKDCNCQQEILDSEHLNTFFKNETEKLKLLTSRDIEKLE